MSTILTEDCSAPGASSLLSSYETLHITLKRTVRNSPALVPNLNQVNAVHSLKNYIYENIFEYSYFIYFYISSSECRLPSRIMD
jgi:hypothetical protein